MNRRWYKVNVRRAHFGARSDMVVNVYIYALDIGELLVKYHKMPGVSRSFSSFYKGRVHSKRFPNVERLSDEEGRRLEQLILDEGKIKLKKAKKTWYYRNDEFVNR